MNKFLVLYCATPETLKHWGSMSKEEADKGMADWGRWMEEKKDVLVDAGTPVGKNTRLTSAGHEEKSNEVCGYSVLAADSREEACRILEGNPHLQTPGTYLEIMNLVQM